MIMKNKVTMTRDKHTLGRFNICHPKLADIAKLNKVNTQINLNYKFCILFYHD